jgi:hypothetical protein
MTWRKTAHIFVINLRWTNRGRTVIYNPSTGQVVKGDFNMALSITLFGTTKNTSYAVYGLRGSTADYQKVTNWLIGKGLIPDEPEFDEDGCCVTDSACLDIGWLRQDSILVVGLNRAADAEAFEFYCTGYTGR